MRRHILGAIGLAGLVYGLVVFFLYGYDGGLNQVFPALCLRLGIVMMTIWLGLPEINRFFAKYPPWIFILAIVLVTVVVIRPKLLPFLIVLVVIGGAIHFAARLFRTRGKKKK
jgi:hypothetical protein